MKTVKAIQVGRKRYRVRYTRLDHEYGRMNPHHAQIAVDSRQSAFEMGDTLMHEVLHAVWAHRKLPSRANEERVVTVLANALLQIARDNKGFLSYIEDLAQKGSQP